MGAWMKEEQRVSNHPDFKRKISNYEDELNKVREKLYTYLSVSRLIFTRSSSNDVIHSH
jgi:hypothetical protein